MKVKKFPVPGVMFTEVRKKNEDFASRIEEVNNRNSKDEADGEYSLYSSTSSDIHWRDAIQETKQWAANVDEETDNLFTLADEQTARITRVLRAPKNSFLSRHSLSLASRILSLSASASSSSASASSSNDSIDDKINYFSAVHASQGRFA